MRISALFAGIAGLELGMERSGHETLMFCEVDPGAAEVLRVRFPGIPVHPDVRQLESFPRDTDLVTAGFPCQDLSQAGTTAGIDGIKTSVVSNLFRLLRKQNIPHVLIENVPFMLQLKQGQAIRFLVEALEELGYNWAYRVVDARAFGVPQRRRRVFLLGSKAYEPWRVLFKSNSKPREPQYSRKVACGFYWTEGKRGLGWAVDAVPTLKGGSSWGIPSPPAIWMPDGRFVTPHLRDAERLQGFRADWTKPSENVIRQRHRWLLIGNAVCVKSADWIGRCIQMMPLAHQIHLESQEFDERKAWPIAAFGFKDKSRATVDITMWPCARKRPGLLEFLQHEPKELSLQAVTGFINRLTDSNLRYPKEFLEDLLEHQAHMAALS